MAGALRVAAAVGLAAYAAHSILHVGGAGADALFEDWVYNALLALAAVLCLLRGVLVREERAAWLTLGAGMSSWSAGVVLTTAQPELLEGTFPTLPDLLWLGFYPAAWVGLVLLVRARVERFYPSLWLDGLIGALALSALMSAVFFPALLEGTGGDPSAVLANLAYPVADLLVLGFVTWVLALTGWRPGRVLGFVAAGLAVGALADAFFLWWAASGHATGRTALDWLWPASTLLLAHAAWQPPRPSALIRLTGLRPLVLPVAFAAISLGILLLSRQSHVDTTGFALASAALAAVIGRMTLTFMENLRWADRSRREAITDSLTGLGNRRRLLRELRESLQVCSEDDPRVLLVFDLDGFKRYNDTFGHPAGDALLARLGANLERAISPHGRAYRLGGDEFCALLDAHPRDVDGIAAAAALALSEQGRGFSVTTSCGAVVLPAEADDETMALQIADERLYAHKGHRRRSVEVQQACNVLKRVLHEREPMLDEHLEGVAALALPIGRRLGMSSEDADVMVRAAQLHDVGKVAIPDDILRKRDNLDDTEAALMREHTVVGERILAAAPALRPVAKVVRATHEHFDGRGYPDGLAADEIPLAARIVAVCDAYEVMITGRSYQPAVGHEQAIAELRRCAGRQFDPEVVEVFCQEVEVARRAQRETAMSAVEVR